MRDHELVVTVMTAVADGASQQQRAEAFAQALQTRNGHEVVGYAVQRLRALARPAETDVDLQTQVMQAVSGSGKEKCVNALIAALQCDHESPEAKDLVLNDLNPLRVASPGAPAMTDENDLDPPQVPAPGAPAMTGENESDDSRATDE